MPILILLLYFLKLKRKPLHVPSTFLWKKSIEDPHVNSLFQWLRENVLLLLQTPTALVLLYALMSFQIHGNMVEGKHYVVMIDNSASMSATDVSPNRLETAKKEAMKEIDAHTDNDTGMVLVFNSSAQILQSYTHDRSLLRAPPSTASGRRSGRRAWRRRSHWPTAWPTRRARRMMPPRGLPAKTRPRRAPCSPRWGCRPRCSYSPMAVCLTCRSSSSAT